jgi:hypothetical protein
MQAQREGAKQSVPDPPLPAERMLERARTPNAKHVGIFAKLALRLWVTADARRRVCDLGMQFRVNLFSSRSVFRFGVAGSCGKIDQSA